jgi:hypothetical protein
MSLIEKAIDRDTAKTKMKKRTEASGIPVCITGG